jgi:hypothetical protein
MNTGILLSGFQPELNQVVKAVVVLCVLIVQSPRFISILKESAAMIKRNLPLMITLGVFVLGYLYCLTQFPGLPRRG